MAASFETPAELGDRERKALETLLKRLADDEFVLAERYTEWQVRAPTLESDLALANNAQDELGHARLWYDVLGDLGYEEPDLVFERDPADFRHSTLVELPFEEGNWADAVLRSYLYDAAEALRLEALEDSAHPKIADRVDKIQSEEEYHLEHARSWLERLAGDADGRDRLQETLDRLFPHALTIFEPCAPPRGANEASSAERSSADSRATRSRDDGDEPRAVDRDVENDIVEFGLRDATLEELGETWLATVRPELESLGLEVGTDATEFAAARELCPDVSGRDGTHTEAWFDLYAEFTHTYNDLERSTATEIMSR